MPMETSPYIGEIRMIAGSFAPDGWVFCNGQTLPIAQNAALFAVLGIRYGGNGTTNFKLPDLRGASPVCAGQQAGNHSYVVGEAGGSATVALQASEIPAHTHVVKASDALGAQNTPVDGVWAQGGIGRVERHFYANAPDGTVMHSDALTEAGESAPHNNMPPYLVLNFIISLVGVWPGV